MNYSDYRFTLDIQIHQAQVSVPVTLNDTARKLCIGLTDGRKPYVIAEGCRAVFAAKKPDNTTILNDCIIERNTIIYEFSQNTTNAEGIVDCEIRLYDANDRELTSPQFIIVVDKKVVRDEEISLSESESTTLDGIIRSELARVAAENERVANEAERIERDGERDEIITFFEDKGGIIISDEEPESDVASIWLKETPTGEEISLLTADDIVQELSDDADKIPSVAVVNKLVTDLEDGNITAHQAESATNDAEGNNIQETYATKDDVAETYATKDDVAETYATKSEVSETYATKTDVDETYATKDEVSEQMGDIDTALDSIIAIQNSLMGGESE